jgi:lysophospholipase L1-like esterase
VVNATTLRQVIRISLGGSYFRVWLTNEFGNEALNVGAANLAVRGADSAIVGSGQTLTFDGQTSVMIDAGTRVVSDPVYLEAADNSDLAISIYLPEDMRGSTSPVTYYPRALQTNYQVDEGSDLTSAPKLEDGPNFGTNFVWAYIAAVDVGTKGPVAVIAALGDSLTDGDQLSTAEPIDLNARYPNFLSEAILANRGPGNRTGQIASVVNVGISGNQVTNDALGDAAVNRLGRDILSQTGVTHVIVWEGINDLGLPPFVDLVIGPGLVGDIRGADDVIAGLRQIAEQSRAAGLKVIGCTITPAGDFGLFTYPAADAARAEINEWIRTTDVFDVVVDLDALVRDPSNPVPAIINGGIGGGTTVDGLHFTSDAYRMIAEAIHGKLFRGNGKHLL